MILSQFQCKAIVAGLFKFARSSESSIYAHTRIGNGMFRYNNGSKFKLNERITCPYNKAVTYIKQEKNIFEALLRGNYSQTFEDFQQMGIFSSAIIRKSYGMLHWRLVSRCFPNWRNK